MTNNGSKEENRNRAYSTMTVAFEHGGNEAVAAMISLEKCYTVDKIKLTLDLNRFFTGEQIIEIANLLNSLNLTGAPIYTLEGSNPAEQFQAAGEYIIKFLDKKPHLTTYIYQELLYSNSSNFFKLRTSPERVDYIKNLKIKEFPHSALSSLLETDGEAWNMAMDIINGILNEKFPEWFQKIKEKNFSAERDLYIKEFYLLDLEEGSLLIQKFKEISDSYLKAYKKNASNPRRVFVLYGRQKGHWEIKEDYSQKNFETFRENIQRNFESHVNHHSAMYSQAVQASFGPLHPRDVITPVDTNAGGLSKLLTGITPIDSLEVSLRFRDGSIRVDPASNVITPVDPASNVELSTVIINNKNPEKRAENIMKKNGWYNKKWAKRLFVVLVIVLIIVIILLLCVFNVFSKKD